MPDVIGTFGTRPLGLIPRSYASTISRSTTSAAVLFTLPPMTTVLGWRIVGTPASNAGTSARISVGSSGGGGKDFVADFNVKGNNGQSFPSSSVGLIADTNPIIVTAVYAEDGSASNTGGPWTVVVETL